MVVVELTSINNFFTTLAKLKSLSVLWLPFRSFYNGVFLNTIYYINNPCEYLEDEIISPFAQQIDPIATK